MEQIINSFARDILTCTASEVLSAGHGICFAKSHLLAAILRCKSVPAGFCYQKLILDDETAPVLIYHGLNGVYIKEYQKWIRLDARGNKEGVKEFHKSIHDEGYLSRLCMYGAFKGDKLVGVIATRSEGTHVALFFVDGNFHRQGIGKKLFQTVRKDCHYVKMTVNSSPYAVPIYHKLGFVDVDKEQVVNGLRFTPMELVF